MVGWGKGVLSRQRTRGKEVRLGWAGGRVGEGGVVETKD